MCCTCCSGKGEKAKKYEKANYSDPNYEGEAVDESLAGGPDEVARHCTDVFCCMIFVAFIVSLVYVMLDAIPNGEPWRLTAVYDA